MIEEKNEVIIESFKHNGELHRIWKNAVIHSIDDEKIIAVIERARVLEHGGREWVTREPAVLYFYFKKWYNVMAMLRGDNIYYYCNIASPIHVEGKKIQYIDYDLDLKTFPNRTFRILDENEFYCHRYAMKYGEKIEKIIWDSLKELKEVFLKGIVPFNDECIHKIYRNFKKG